MDALAAHRMRWASRAFFGACSGQQAESIVGFAHGIEHAAEQARSDQRQRRTIGGGDFTTSVEASGLAERHEQNMFATETNDLGVDGKIIAIGAQAAKFAQTDIGAFGFDDQAGDAGDMAWERRASIMGTTLVMGLGKSQRPKPKRQRISGFVSGFSIMGFLCFLEVWSFGNFNSVMR
jgi:hypothetical protein